MAPTPGRGLSGNLRKLHVIRFSADQGGFVLSARRGARTGSYILPLDDDLLDHVDRARDEESADEEVLAVAPRSTIDSALSPREIQARLRSGRSVAEVAAEAGVSMEWVDRFAAPIQAEQAAAVARAGRATVHTPRRGPSDRPLEASLLRNLAERGVSMSEEEMQAAWSARHLIETDWLICFRFRNRGRAMTAEWLLNSANGALTPRNRLGTEMGFIDPGRRVTAVAPAEVSTDGPPGRPATGRRRLSAGRRGARRATARKAPAARTSRRTAKRVATKAPVRRKAAAVKAPARKKAAAVEAAARKVVAAKKVVAGKKVASSGTKTTGRKTVPTKRAAVTKKAAASKRATPTKKAATRVVTPAPAVKRTVTKTAAKRTPVKRTPVKRTPAKRTPASKMAAPARTSRAERVIRPVRVDETPPPAARVAAAPVHSTVRSATIGPAGPPPVPPPAGVHFARDAGADPAPAPAAAPTAASPTAAAPTARPVPATDPVPPTVPISSSPVSAPESGPPIRRLNRPLRANRPLRTNRMANPLIRTEPPRPVFGIGADGSESTGRQLGNPD